MELKELLTNEFKRTINVCNEKKLVFGPTDLNALADVAQKIENMNVEEPNYVPTTRVTSIKDMLKK